MPLAPFVKAGLPELNQHPINGLYSGQINGNADSISLWTERLT